MTIETTVLDFKLSNTFEEYEARMKSLEQQVMFNEIAVKTFYIEKSIEEQSRAKVIIPGAKNVLYDIVIKSPNKTNH